MRSDGWLGRHPNVAIVIGLSVYFVLAFGALARPFMYWVGASPLFWVFLNWVPATLVLTTIPTGEIGDQFPSVSNLFILGACSILPMWWALRQKGRGPVWLLPLLIPFGWIAPIAVKETPRLVVESPANNKKAPTP